jgi:regulator of RNase E activity RraB
MGQKDKVEKLLEDYPDVFADIINVLIYDGKQVIKPQELSETKVKSQYKAADDSLHEQERDILKVWEKGKDYKIIFGIENQTNTDKTMTFRVMAYDGASYRSQLLSDEDKKDEKGEVTMCTILDHAINTGITQGEALKLIMLVQKKMKKGDSMTKIADDLLEDEITILPIYNLAKKYPEDTEKDIYQRLN